MLKAVSAMDVERFFEVLGGAGLMGASHEAETGRIGVAAELLQGHHWRSQAILASQIAVGDSWRWWDAKKDRIAVSPKRVATGSCRWKFDVLSYES